MADADLMRERTQQDDESESLFGRVRKAAESFIDKRPRYPSSPNAVSPEIERLRKEVAGGKAGDVFKRQLDNVGKNDGLKSVTAGSAKPKDKPKTFIQGPAGKSGLRFITRGTPETPSNGQEE